MKNWLIGVSVVVLFPVWTPLALLALLLVVMPFHLGQEVRSLWRDV